MEQARQAVLRVSQGWVAPARREAAVTPGGAARGHQAGARATEADQAEALIMDWYHWTRGYRPKLGVGRIAASRAAWCRTTPMSTAKTWMRA